MRCRVASTYHPAYLFRNPSASMAVESHLRLLSNALDGKEAFTLGEITYAVNPTPPPYPIRTLSLDIESYGIVEGLPLQTQWQPQKSVAYDRVPISELVQTLAFSWRDPAGELKSAIFSKAFGFENAWAWLRKAHAEQAEVLGQNLAFDLTYLRFAYPETRAWLRKPLRLADLSVTNYLHNEVRPERSLKNLAPLFGITKYEPGFRRYPSNVDAELFRYNCQDTAATLLTNEKLWEEIRQFYGESSPKLSEFNRAWYSDLLWLVLYMSEHGIAMLQSGSWSYTTEKGPILQTGLEELYARYGVRVRRLIEYADRRWKMPLKGEGSEKAKREAIQIGVDAAGEGASDLDLIVTKKRRKLSFCDKNRNTLLGVLDRTSDAACRLRIMGRFADASKIMDSYLKPLLLGRGQENSDPSTRVLGGIVRPKWFPVPSQFDDGGSGGTIQARIVCRGPGVQTFPPIVKSRITCRYPGGSLCWWDLSQIELRVAALLSGDPVMLSEYAGGIDRHTETAKMIFSPGIVTHHLFKSLYRQAGKTLNFLVLFRGGAKKFQQTLVEDVGIYLPLEECQDAIERMRTKYVRLWQWQDELIAQAKRLGYLELPLIGQSRLYLGGRRAVEDAMNEIVNQPVQTTAANIMLSAQSGLVDWMAERGLRSLCPLNVYDAATVEVFPGEEASVKLGLDQCIPDPPYFRALCGHLGRCINLSYEATWKLNRKAA